MRQRESRRWARGLNIFNIIKKRLGAGRHRMENKNKETKELRGRQFNVVKRGLSEEQVDSFLRELDDLKTRYRALLEQQEHSASLRSLSEKTIMEADRVATDIKLRAKREAEAEVAKIIAEAKQRSQDMMEEAKRSAETATKEEVEDILAVADKRAEMIETEARQRAHSFLIRAREKIEGQMREEIKEVYYRLLSSLQDLLNQGHNIETEWKRKTTELWKSERFELEGYEAALSRAWVAELAEPVTPEGEIEPEAVSEERVEEVVQPLPEAVPPAPMEVAAQELPLEKIPEEPGKEAAPTLPTEKSQALYAGEVELEVSPPVDIAKMSELTSRLEAIPEIKILRTVGSWDRGTTIAIMVDKAIPLISLLSVIPNIEAMPGLPEKRGFMRGPVGLPGPGGKGVERIKLIFKTE